MRALVPVDGSKHSMESLKVAAHIAKTWGAWIYIMTVIPYVSDIDLELSPSERDRLLESMKARGEDILGRARSLMESLGVTSTIKTVLSTSASAASEIISFAEAEKVSLIVIGSKGTGASSQFALGSVVSKIVRHSPCCVHVVKEPCWV